MVTSTPSELRGFPVQTFTLQGDSCVAVVTDLGARLLEMHVPDREGALADVVIGRPDLETTFTDPAYMGSTVGRYAGRIRRGRFTLDGVDHQVGVNEGDNHLHGGVRGFDKYVWSSRVHPDEEAVTFTRVSPDGEEGFPGQVVATSTYRLTGEVLEIEMTATTDRATPLGMVNHSYWNMAGQDSGDLLDQELEVFASHYLPTDEGLVPTGEVLSVGGTPYDFRDPHTVGERIRDIDNSGAGRVAGGIGGYDHVWVLDGLGRRVVARLTDPTSGRRLELESDQAGVCLYTGGYLEGFTSKSRGPAYPAFAGLTLETQGLPDDPNKRHFPTSVLKPGDVYVNSMRFTFSTS